MDLYVVSLATGAVGLGVMAIGGLSHAAGGHMHAGHGHGHAGAGHAHGVGHPGAAHGGGHGAHATHGEGQAATGWNWSSLLSPRLLFSVLVGFGATGLIAASLPEPLRALAALGGAAAFEALLVGPLWRFL